MKPGRSIAPRTIRPEDVNVPIVDRSVHSSRLKMLFTQRESRSRENKPDKSYNRLKVHDKPDEVLDGFKLIEACHCELPEDGRRANLSNMGLKYVVAEDLTYFINLAYLDVSENDIPFDDRLAPLQNLIELRMQYNSLSTLGPIPSGSFRYLRVKLKINNKYVLLLM